MNQATLRQFLRENLFLEVVERPKMMPWTEIRLMMRNDFGALEIISRATIPVEEG